MAPLQPSPIGVFHHGTAGRAFPGVGRLISGATGGENNRAGGGLRLCDPNRLTPPHRIEPLTTYDLGEGPLNGS